MAMSVAWCLACGDAQQMRHPSCNPVRVLLQCSAGLLFMVHATPVLLLPEPCLDHRKQQACPGEEAEALLGCLGNKRKACGHFMRNDSSP